MIIGITGTLGAGKGTIAEYLCQKGFRHYSVRQFIVEEIKKRDLPINRDNMVMVANDLRAKNSPSYIVEQLYQKARQEGANCIIESIRTEGEATALKGQDEFYLIAVDADPEKRYQRAIGRKSITDNVTYEQFMAEEKREMTSDDPNKQNLSKCQEIADFKIDNSGTLDELYQKIDGLIQKINE